MASRTRFYNRQVAESLSTPHHIISIGEHGDGWKLHPCQTHVLRLLFHDLEEFISQKYTLFSPEHAHTIIQWLQPIPEGELVIVHCEAGIARSAAIVKFMVDKLGYEFEADRYSNADYSLMNHLVYDTLVAVYAAIDKTP